MAPSIPANALRAIWISDVHLGTSGCKAEFLLDFLKHHESDTLYLVGDIVDGWQLRRNWTWQQSHNDVVQKILRKVRKGTRVIYVPGNHDEFARDFIGLAFGGIDIAGEAVHTMADGRRLWIVHGDMFDGIVQHARWLAFAGDSLYTITLALNHWYNRLRVLCGRPYWSLSQYLKHKVKNAVRFMSDFEHALIAEARRRGYDGVVCGHIHKAEIREIDGMVYCNDGDWVESLTALIEHHDGRLEIVHWPFADGPPAEIATHAATEIFEVRVEASQSLMEKELITRILMVTDAWDPQVNGVVRTLKQTGREIERAGHTAWYLTPQEFRSVPCPTYPEIRLALFPGRGVAERIDRLAPDALHIATEGPLGLAARRHALRHGLAFTTAYHTRFPEYVQARIGVPLSVTYRFLRRFHAPASAVLVPTPAIAGDLEKWGFDKVVLWSRGVDLAMFSPEGERLARGRGPVFLYVGRIAVEKNLEAFLALDLPGEKWVAGEGPQRGALERRYPGVRWFGQLAQEALAQLYRSADAFVFPSRTDTFGLVLLEAMACGLPVAAYPVAGPIDVVGGGGVLRDDLRAACLAALHIPRETARAHAEKFSWAACTAQFLHHMHPMARRSAA